jgi:hypothetical protein
VETKVKEFQVPRLCTINFINLENLFSIKVMNSTDFKIDNNAGTADGFDLFLALFNGLDKIGGTGENLVKAIEFIKLNESVAREVIYACSVFSTKPPNLLVTGLTKSGREVDSGPVDQSIAKFLPKLSAADKANWDKTTQDKHDEHRAKWGEFKNVNLSMIRNIFYLCSELMISDKQNDVIKNWIKRNNGRPSKINLDLKEYTKDDLSKMEPDMRAKKITASILQESLTKFMRSYLCIENSIRTDWGRFLDKAVGRVAVKRGK